MVKHVQSFQNNKFAFSLQYLGKEVKTSLNATNWFTYTHFKQVWSDMAAHAQCAYNVLAYCACLSLLSCIVMQNIPFNLKF